MNEDQIEIESLKKEMEKLKQDNMRLEAVCQYRAGCEKAWRKMYIALSEEVHSFKVDEYMCQCDCEEEED